MFAVISQMITITNYVVEALHARFTFDSSYLFYEPFRFGVNIRRSYSMRMKSKL